MAITVSIVEDDEKLRSALARLIDQTDGMRCLSTYETAEKALEGLPEHPPRIVLMDINLPGMSGVDCVRQLKAKLPDVQVLMLTVYEDTESVFGALTAGASGYLLKRARPQQLLEAIYDLDRGGSPMTGHIARKVVQSFQSGDEKSEAANSLSPREEQVLKCLSNGYQYKEIAEELAISTETVRTYIRRIYEKLHARSAAEAVAIYLKK